MKRQKLSFENLVKTAPVSQEDVDWADIILGNVPAGFLHGGEKLKWLQAESACVEAYIRPGALAPGAVLTNGTGAYGLAISEHMLALTLAVLKKLELYRDNQRLERWESLGGVRSIYKSTVLVLGMGDIGGAFGKQCKALGAKVIGVRRTNTARPDYADEVHLIGSLDRLLPQADIVVVTPHISGFYHLRETHTRVVNLFAENLSRFLNGDPLKNQVDTAIGYRKTVA